MSDKEYEAFLKTHPAAMTYSALHKVTRLDKLDEVVRASLQSDVRYDFLKRQDEEGNITYKFTPIGNSKGIPKGVGVEYRREYHYNVDLDFRKNFTQKINRDELKTVLAAVEAYNPGLSTLLNDVIGRAKNSNKSIKDGYADDLQKIYQFRDEVLEVMAGVYRKDDKGNFIIKPDIDEKGNLNGAALMAEAHLKEINKKYGTDFSLDVLKKRGNEPNEILSYAFTLVKNPNGRNNPYKHESLKEIPLKSRYGFDSESLYEKITGQDKTPAGNEKEAPAVEKQDEKTVSSAGQQAEIGARIAAARERIGLKFDGTDKFSPNPANIAQTDRRLAEYMAISGRA